MRHFSRRRSHVYPHLGALRDELWLAPSYSVDGLSMPFDAVASDYAAAVVVHVAESVGLSSGLFDRHAGVLASASRRRGRCGGNLAIDTTVHTW